MFKDIYYNLHGGQMTKGDLDGVEFFHRPVKPLAGFTMLLMLTYMIFNMTQVNDLISSTWLGHAMAIIAGISAFCLGYGWFARIQQMAEIGLLVACFVYITASVNFFLLEGFASEYLWLSFWSAGLVGSAFYLEARDRIDAERRI